VITKDSVWTLLVVDSLIKPNIGQYAMLRHEGMILCRLMVYRNGKIVFTNGNTDIRPIPDETEVIGAVTSYIQVYNTGDSYGNI